MFLTSSDIPKAEFDVDESLVRRLLQEQHSDLADLPIKLLGNGWDNNLFRLGKNLVVRLPRRQLGADFIVNELSYLPELAPRLPIKTSVAIRKGEPGCGYPWPWAITEWIEGDTADLSPPTPKAAKHWAEFLRALHYPAPANGPRNPARGIPLAVRASHCEERMLRLRDKNEINFQAVNRIWQSGLDADPTFSDCWLHGDLHLLNILCKDGHFSGVIDWGDLCIGDSACDLASFWILFDDDIATHSIQHEYRASDAQILRAKAAAVFFAMVLLDTGLNVNRQQEHSARIILRNLNAE